MNEPISLQKHRNKKKYAKVITELENVITIHNLSIRALSIYSKYGAVMESMAVLAANKMMLELHLQKLKNSVK